MRVLWPYSRFTSNKKCSSTGHTPRCSLHFFDKVIQSYFQFIFSTEVSHFSL